jgi:hypothetical protein
MVRPFLLLLAVLATANASIFLPTTSVRSLADTGRSSAADVAFHRRRNANRVLKSRAIAADGKPLAMAIPGNSVAEQVVIGGECRTLCIMHLQYTDCVLVVVPCILSYYMTT